ncbi:hypothetical protein BJ508DRAFT_414570 [Ascobolus immersus RN42]|uniref:Zn(2)-C6 fungal-type domain-containing protein n=1 Tax=Ascobolus immersus RN42 TaxID=1160509 RepID=A0A3N4IB12_ASCIM|nr:hypothetical protein BJ508DRAFT_414570 [Ascobolus immersus RN42]
MDPFSRLGDMHSADNTTISHRLKTSSLSSSLQQCTPRQRTAIACRYCRRRKIRCSGFENADDGRCLNCQRFSQECVFTPVSTHNPAIPQHNHIANAVNPIQPKFISPIRLSNQLEPEVFRLPQAPQALPYEVTSLRDFQSRMGFPAEHVLELSRPHQNTPLSISKAVQPQLVEERDAGSRWPHYERNIGVHAFLPLPDEKTDHCAQLPRIPDSRSATDKFMLDMLKPRKGL